MDIVAFGILGALAAVSIGYICIGLLMGDYF